MASVLNSLTEAELAVVRSAEPKVLVDLDEDGLIELHGRVHRSRDKFVGQYRRQAAAVVAETGAGGVAYERNQAPARQGREGEPRLIPSRPWSTKADRASPRSDGIRLAAKSLALSDQLTAAIALSI